MLSDFKTDECGRMAALRRLDVLDSGEEQPFEKIISLVQQVLDVPMCAVSLIDRDRQWFKARRGLDVAETPRDISFCTHAIRNQVPLIVRDATADPRFSSNPLVTGAPHIRSYAGVPLKMPDGYNVGTLCAIDTSPREFPDHEVEILANFATIIADELELRQIAATDVLSGAMSRRAWLEAARTEFKRATRYSRPMTVMILDIDHFKSINDTFGHPVGDQVIRRLSDLGMEQIRETDAFGRYGGEEFVVLLPETTPDAAMVLAERIRIACAETRFDALGDRQVTISIGLADRQAGEKTLDAVLERADKALYQAKHGGRNRSVSAAREPSPPRAVA